MPNFPSASAVAIPPTNTVPAASGAIAVDASISSLPAKIQQLARQIEISGTLAEPPSSASITLNTAVGPLALLVTQLVQVQQSKLLQQLIAAYQSQRPLTVVMQPGNPPEQAVLVLPNSTTAAASVTSISNAANQTQTVSAATPPPPLPVNVPLAAVVLPNDVEVPMLTLAEFQAQMPVAPTVPAEPYANFNPDAGFEPVALPNANAASDLPLAPAAALPIETFPAAEIAQPLATATIEATETLAATEQQLPPNPTIPQTPVTPAVNAPAPQETTSVVAPQTSPTIAPVIVNSEPASQTPGLPSLSPPEPTSALATLLQPGTEVNVSVTAIIDAPAPGQAAPSLPVLQSNQILGTVIGNAPNGQIMVKTDDATLFIRQPASAPAGTQLILTVEPGHNAAPALLTLQDPAELTTLPQVIAALAQADPAMMMQIMADRMPQPGQSLPGTLLFFLSAVRDGDVGGWLGNGAADLLTRAGKMELLTRLAQDLQSSGQLARDDVVGEWRSYAVPILDNHQLAYLYFHIHGDHRRHHASSHEKPGERTGSQQMRFVIDMRMSRLGPMQLDGFLRPKKLDIIMRSERNLPPWLDNELRHTYARTLGAIGYTGGIIFQSGRGNWVNVQKPAAGKALVT